MIDAAAMEQMICTCELDGMREVETRRLDVMRRLGVPRMENLTSAVIFSLAFDFRADADIAADMWFGTGIETPLVPAGLFVQCDWPEDGLAYLWTVLADAFPEVVTKGPATEEDFAVAARASADLLAAKAAHRATHSDSRSTCGECDVCTDAWVARLHSVREAWGSAVLDKAIDIAFGD